MGTLWTTLLFSGFLLLWDRSREEWKSCRMYELLRRATVVEHWSTGRGEAQTSSSSSASWFIARCEGRILSQTLMLLVQGTFLSHVHPVAQKGPWELQVLSIFPFSKKCHWKVAKVSRMVVSNIFSSGCTAVHFFSWGSNLEGIQLDLDLSSCFLPLAVWPNLASQFCHSLACVQKRGNALSLRTCRVQDKFLHLQNMDNYALLEGAMGTMPWTAFGLCHSLLLFSFLWSFAVSCLCFIVCLFVWLFIYYLWPWKLGPFTWWLGFKNNSSGLILH